MQSVGDFIVMWTHEWDVGFRGIDDAGPSMQAPIIEPQIGENQTETHQTPILSDLNLDLTEVSRLISCICNKNFRSKSFISIFFFFFK